MQTDNIEGIEGLSRRSRKQLTEQIERVQKEARKLRAQAQRLSHEQQKEVKQRQKSAGPVVQVSKERGQGIFQRGNDLATTGLSLASEQLRTGQRKALEYSGSLAQSANQTAQNLSDWGGDTSNRLFKQGQGLGRSAADWSDDTSYRLRKQGKHLVHKTSDWSDDASYQVRKQGQTFLLGLADWYDEMIYQMRRQVRKLGNTLEDRKAETARQVYRQKRDLGRNVASRRDDTAHQLRRQGRTLSRGLAGRRDDATRQLRKQRDYLSERGGQMLEPMRESKLWSIFGFASGLLLAGGITYWLIKRGLSNNEPEQEEAIELEPQEPLSSAVHRPLGEVRSVSQGGTVVVTRPATSAGPNTRFVGVMSTRRYYPIGRQPEALDLVYFDNEIDARAQGFSAVE